MLREYSGDGYYYGGNSAGMVGEFGCGLLAYWSSKDKVCRKLAKVARGLLSVAASSTSSEHSFSLAGNTLADRRSRLSPELVDGLMLLHGLK